MKIPLVTNLPLTALQLDFCQSFTVIYTPTYGLYGQWLYLPTPLVVPSSVGHRVDSSSMLPVPPGTMPRGWIDGVPSPSVEHPRAKDLDQRGYYGHQVISHPYVDLSFCQSVHNAPRCQEFETRRGFNTAANERSLFINLASNRLLSPKNDARNSFRQTSCIPSSTGGLNSLGVRMPCFQTRSHGSDARSTWMEICSTFPLGGLRRHTGYISQPG